MTYFYPARAEGEFASVLAALLDAGCSEHDAQLFIANAAASGTPYVLAPLSEARGYLVTTTEAGTAIRWQACIGLATVKREDALRSADELRDSMGDDSTVAVFEYTPVKYSSAQQKP